MAIHTPDILGAIEDRVNVLAFRTVNYSVHTRNGDVGEVFATNLLRGEILIRTSSCLVKARGRDVDDLDSPLS